MRRVREFGVPEQQRLCGLVPSWTLRSQYWNNMARIPGTQIELQHMHQYWNYEALAPGLQLDLPGLRQFNDVCRVPGFQVSERRRLRGQSP